MADVFIKPDPEVRGTSPAAFADEDIYEDAGDLEFNTDLKYQKLYLARVPKYIWDSWHNLDDDAEIQLGTIRMSTEKGSNGTEQVLLPNFLLLSYRKLTYQKVKLQMLLNPDLPQHQGVPKEYELEVTDESVKNTFIFTEQDLPGYKSRANTKFDPAIANMPARLSRPKPERTREKQPWDKNKKYQPYTSKGIPSASPL
jgi:transcription initiation factor TFIIF subunit beta